ncbi:MAG TPA: ParB/RepB/Spo0J family partition protein [Verrucomicrobiae bacterium]|jgi:ParB family chromosome partitioning protein|nr:ParB/RepB/Spo0J family partition protein [Verrucomicrobiae bacterium]
MAKPALGRGLGALIGGSSAAAKPSPSPAAAPALDARERVERAPIAKVRPSALQPRKDFSPDALNELADSIRAQGIVQPLIVRARGDEYELIAGERRWRAAQLAGLKEVPVLVREADDRAVLQWALIENLQRENLNAIEEALGYAQLIEQFKMTQEEAAAKVGKSRPSVANALRLLKLDPMLQNWVREGRLSVGHGKVILGLTDHAQQRLAAERALQKSLNVRQTEELVSFLQSKGAELPGAKKTSRAVSADAHLDRLQERVQQRFGTKAHVRYHQGKGSIEIKFFSDDDLDRILKVAGIDLE